jgi:hypothetical protein
MKRRTVRWIGHIICRKCLLKHNVEGKIEEGTEFTVRRGRRCRQLMDDFKNRRALEIERGSTRSHSVAIWHWKRLCTSVRGSRK